MIDFQFENEDIKITQRDHVNQLAKTIHSIKDSLPMDAEAKVTLAKGQGGCSADVSIRYAQGCIAANGIGKTFEHAVNECVRRLHHQLQFWHLMRFVNPFGMEKQSEENFFQQYLSLAPLESSKKEKVLIVEDDPTSGIILETIFQKLGYATSLLSDGAKAIQVMGEENHDVIVLDWCLPYKNGDEIVNEVQNSLQDKASMAKHVPVITCSAMPRNVIRFPDQEYFSHVDHWQKVEGFSSIVEQVQRVMRRLAN